MKSGDDPNANLEPYAPFYLPDFARAHLKYIWTSELESSSSSDIHTDVNQNGSFGLKRGSTLNFTPQ